MSAKRACWASSLLAALALGPLLLLGVGGRPAQAAVCTSQADGNWSNPGIWSGCSGYPGQYTNDSVVVNHNITLDISPGAVYRVDIQSGGTLTFGGANVLKISAGGGSPGLSNGGVFSAGSGTVEFNTDYGNAGASVSGNVAFNNVVLTGVGVDFGSNAAVHGTLQINAGGYVNTTAPAYGSSSLLKYNSGGTYGRGLEWSATSGAGYPANVQIGNNTTLNLGNGGTGTARQMSGDLTIDGGSTLSMDESGAQMTAALTVLGSVDINGTLTLSGQSGGDIKVGGNWTRAATGTFNHNSRAVFFNGTGTQTIAVTGGGTETFAYLVVDKSSGTLVLSGSPATDVTVNGSSGDVLQILNTGGVDLNGRTLTLSGAGGNLKVGGGARAIAGSSGSRVSFTGAKTVVSASGGTLTFGADVVVALAAGVDFGSSLTTINGTLQMDDGGWVNANPPTYGGSASTLRYNKPGSSYTAGAEWTAGATSGAGVPYNVQVSGYGLDLGSSTSARTALGDVTIDSGSALALSTADGGDLNVGGDWSNNGAFNCNGRQVAFNGSGAQSIGGSQETAFDYLLIDNSGSGVATLAQDIAVNRQLKINDNDAELSAGSYRITMRGDADNGPLFYNNGRFDAGTGTVLFTGDGTNNKHARVWGSPPVVTTFYNVTISRVAGGSGNFGVDFYDHSTGARAHIAGTLTLNANTFVASEEDGSGGGCASVPDGCDGTPTYDSGSTLVYNNGGSFDSGAEWWPDDATPTCGGDKGMPFNVTVANNTALDINAAFANGGKSPSYAAGANKTACGTVTIQGGSALQSTAGILSVKGDWTRYGTFSHNNGTVRFNGNVGTGNCQTVSGDNTFYDLAVSPASGAVCFGSTTTTVVHNLTKSGGGTMNPGTGKFIFTGSPGAILGDGAKYFYDLEIAATTNHTTGGGVHVRHSLVNNGTFTEGAGQDIFFDGGGNINLSGSGTTTFGSVWVQSASTLHAGTHSFRVVGDRFAVYSTNIFDGGTATVSFANGTGTVLNGSLSNLGTYNFYNLIIETGAVVLGPVYGSKTINVAGDWTNNGAYTHNGGTVVLNGSGAQMLGGSSSTTFAHLTVNNSSADSDGVKLGVNQKVTGILTLTDGLVKVGDRILTIGEAGSISGGSAASMVVTHEDGSETGMLCREYPDGDDQDPAAFTFPVGDAFDITNYSTATLDFAAGSDFSSGSACVRVTDAKHPNNNSPLHYLTRYWTVTSSGISGFSCAASFAYVDADIVGTETGLVGLKYDSPNWTSGDPVEAGRNNFQMTVSSFSDFTAGNNPTAVKLISFGARPTAGGLLLSWETASEWNNAGFNLYRRVSLDEGGVRLNGELIGAERPGGDEGFHYTFLDATAAPGTVYYYTLEDVDFSGRTTAHGPIAAALWRAYFPIVER